MILEEPHIDTVEVSDETETDEENIPLVRLVTGRLRQPKKKKKSIKSAKPEENLNRIMWGMYDYYCVQCHFQTMSRAEYKKHLKQHSTVLQVCELCGYTTASEAQYARHKKKHKDERRFKCHMCDYKARHKMSLIYHMKTHNVDVKSVKKAKKDFECDRCGFKTDVTVVGYKHIRSCRVSCGRGMKHACDQCEYSTKRKSDLKRHKARRHEPDDEDT